MASPPASYQTEDWCGYPHYVCLHCGYNTFELPALDIHWCRPLPETPVVLVPGLAVTAAASPAAPPAPAEGQAAPADALEAPSIPPKEA